MKSAEATSAATTNAASAAASKDEGAAMDEYMKRQGFKVTTMNGEKRYCKTAAVLGSRLNNKNICWTAEQVKSHESYVQTIREKQGQRETYPGNP